jgi:tetratricopeptide (TPR) repeat protein
MEAPPDDSLRAAFERAVGHHQAGRLAEAETGYREILAADPGHAGALHLSGMIGHQTGDPDLAVTLISKAVAIAPDYAEAHNNLGNALKDLGRLDEAVASYRRCIAIAPGYAMAHNNLGSALADQGQTEDAIACYRTAIELVPDYAVAHYNLGNALRDTDRAEEAAACYRRAIAIAPGLAEAHNNLGTVLSAQGKSEEAAACYRRAIKIAPDYAVAHNNLGREFKEQGKLDEAVASFRRALKFAPEYAMAHGNLGSVLLAQGALDEAIACYRRTIDLAPDYADAHYTLSTLLNAVDLPAEAKLALEEGCRLRPLTTIACTAGEPLVTILKLVGLPSTRLSLKDGEPTITGANLDTDALIDKEKFTVHEFFVHRNNLIDIAADLPSYDVVLNGIVDPDVEMASINTAQAFISSQDAPVINDPARVLLTTRDKMCRLLTGIDNLIVPKVVKETLSANDPSLFMPVVEKHGLRFPLIVRFAGGHVGAGMTKVDCEQDFARVEFMTNIPVFYFTEFHDYADNSGLYSKYRIYFVDSNIILNHIFISDQWNIHADMARNFMKNLDWTKKFEDDFLENSNERLGERNLDALKEVNRRVGLAYFGMDLSILPDGRLILFECNPAMSYRGRAYTEREHFLYKEKYALQVADAFSAFLLARFRR